MGYMDKKSSSELIFVVMGEPASKANQRRLVRLKNGRTMFIKSKKAFDYATNFDKDCMVLDDLFEGDLSVEMLIYYSTRRPDLDESLILDLMQGKIYKNDRQVKVKKIYWGLDKDNPRTVISISKLEEDFLPTKFKDL